jgi:hypothetical protein
VQPQSWINDGLPDMLWAALLIAHLPRDYALSIIREVAGYAVKFRGSKEHLDITDTEAIVGILTSQADRRQVLRPLALLEDLPARECWCNALETPDEAEDWELLKVAVALTLDHASQEATDCRWARVLFVMAAGKLLFPQEELAEEVAKEIHYYPATVTCGRSDQAFDLPKGFWVESPSTRPHHQTSRRSSGCSACVKQPA